METMKQLFLVLLLSAHCYAQKQQVQFTQIKWFNTLDKEVTFNTEISIYETFKFCAEPQFGGVFENSFKYIEGVTNFNQFYNFFDFGLNLGLNKELAKGLKLKGICNLGMLRFRSYDVVKPEHYMVKLSLSFVF